MEEQAFDIADCISVEDTAANSAVKNSLWKFCISVTLPRSVFSAGAFLNKVPDSYND